MQPNLRSYTDKAQARRELSRIRADIGGAAEYSKKLCDALVSMDEYKQADTVLLYFPTKSEPDLTDIAARAWSDGKAVAFPISRTDDLSLDFRTVRNFSELCIGAYSIREPSENAEPAVLSENTLCIVPALAVDVEGYRLGYGKGYYDRFLSVFSGKAVLPIHSSLVCHRLPRLDTDVQIRTIITEMGEILRI